MQRLIRHGPRAAPLDGMIPRFHGEAGAWLSFGPHHKMLSHRSIQFCSAIFIIFNHFYVLNSPYQSSRTLNIKNMSVCGECKFLPVNSSAPNGTIPVHVKMTKSSGFGRTGNSVYAMFNAMKLAYACKSILQLPSTDDLGAFHPQGQFFNFSQRSGNASSHPLCTQELVEGHQKRFFWFHVPMELEPEVTHDLWACMRQFLGICVEGLCSNQLSAQDGVLTVHLRHGDIFPAGFLFQHNHDYQQPFLEYYYSIINFTNPQKIIFVGEDYSHGPVWKAFKKLHSFGMTRFDIQFQSSSFRDDLVTMLCARTMVESMSSLMRVVRLGFATRRFSTCCENHFPEAQEVYRVETGTFNGARHDNSAEEWVAMLLEGSDSNAVVPWICTAETLVDDVCWRP